MSDVQHLIADMGQRARHSARALALATTVEKNTALNATAQCLRASKSTILCANADDMAAAKAKGLSPAMLDRLLLDDARIEDIATSLENIAALPDPVGDVMSEWQRPNGLVISRVRVPLGVIGVIYESRPNVTADAGALCLKAGNAVILRGGSESIKSNTAIHTCLKQGLKQAGLSEDAIQLVPTTDRAAVGEMLKASGVIDIIVPRGGRSLVERVQNESRVPVFAHLEGICHVYIDKEADPEKALTITLNAKMRRTGICGSLETLLVDSAAHDMLPPIIDALIETGCEVRGDEDVQAMDGRVIAALGSDWDTEYLDAIISIKMVDGVTG
ncbi:MAG: glutamate-5-semialdehyde dehydrogenase, partial [Sphingomonadales bacterium]|nr:glutamate-5-semialdehyde dehydrogenase [Sphingomonadales bacterium]